MNENTPNRSDAEKKLEERERNVIRPGLSRTYELLHRLGDPQRALSFVHVAGTNGKGSACAMLESVLRCAGYRTGLYTSPHLRRLNEEIRVNGIEIQDTALTDVLARTFAQAEGMADPPSRFEIMTAAAFLYFYECRCGIVILEAGMGGALDATNVIPPPEACVIMNIGLDHTAYLGDTTEKIAQQKAGIIKHGSYAICYDLPGNVRGIIDGVCRTQQVPVRYADFTELHMREQKICYHGKSYHLSLHGSYQRKNAAVVSETVEVLRMRGWQITEKNMADGLAGTKWPARFEILRADPFLVLDGGHNLQCARAFADSLSDLCSGCKWIFLLGMLQDKDYETVIDLLCPLTQAFFCVTPESERALPAETLCAVIRRKGINACSYETIEEGLKAFLRESESTHQNAAVFGSLYLAGPVRDLLTDI